MIEVVLINDVRIWLNVLKIVHIQKGVGDGVSDLHMEEGTIYNAKSDPGQAAKAITSRMRSIYGSLSK